MLPAYSIIFFTVASGAGYGLLVSLGLAHLTGLTNTTSIDFRVAGLLAFCLITAGLLSSTAHLGHPERAWRAFSQWRSSWLSREGIFAVLTYIPLTLALYFSWFEANNDLLLHSLSLAIIVLALVTVFSTAMIYASLKPIQRWHHPLVPVQYLLFAVCSGALLYVAIAACSNNPHSHLLLPVGALIIISWVVKFFYWKILDNKDPNSTIESATGLGQFGKVTPLDAPHTSKNYVQKEMGFVVARKHAEKLRIITLVFGSAIPTILLVNATMASMLLQAGLIVLASICLIIALLIERWLFFAEAEHVSILFYGKPPV